MFTIKFETDNDAFADEQLEPEVARILRRIGQDISEEGKREGKVKDVNGNTVGSWRLAS